VRVRSLVWREEHPRGRSAGILVGTAFAFDDTCLQSGPGLTFNYQPARFFLSLILMKTQLGIAVVGLFLICLSINVDAAILVDSTKSKNTEPRSKKKRFITFGYSRNVAILELYPGRNFKHSHVYGDINVEDNGLRFTPRTEAPDGVNEEVFRTAWWYNSFFKEIYIPYNEIKWVKGGGRLFIKTKDGRKFEIITRDYKAQQAAIIPHLTP
jgi:hypothetical protein